MSNMAIYVGEKLGRHLGGPKRSTCPNCLFLRWSHRSKCEMLKALPFGNVSDGIRI